MLLGLWRAGAANLQGGPGSVRLRFVHGTVRAVPVFGSDDCSAERVSVRSCTVQGHGTVPVSVSEKRFGRFWFRIMPFGSWKNGSDGSGFRS